MVLAGRVDLGVIIDQTRPVTTYPGLNPKSILWKLQNGVRKCGESSTMATAHVVSVLNPGKLAGMSTSFARFLLSISWLLHRRAMFLRSVYPEPQICPRSKLCEAGTLQTNKAPRCGRNSDRAYGHITRQCRDVPAGYLRHPSKWREISKANRAQTRSSYAPGAQHAGWLGDNTARLEGLEGLEAL